MTDWPPLKEKLTESGLFAKKSLGQHFLLDTNLTDKICRLANITYGDTIIEIGPGPGGLTRSLLSTNAKKIIAIEKDSRFATHLREYFSGFSDRLEIIEADALKTPIMALLKERNITPESAKIIANLPYNIGTQLLIDWLHDGAWRLPMALMFQKEVAQRICAPVKSASYGRLAVLVAALMDCEIIMNVPATAFVPPPKVESAVVALTPIKSPFPYIKELGKITATAFGQRRKMLRATLGKMAGMKQILEDLGINPTCRPEELTPQEFMAIARIPNS